MILGMRSSVSGLAITAVISQNFLTDMTVPSWLDNSGTTGNRMYYDSTGKLTYAPANLLVRSQEFDNASWTKTSSTISPNSVAAPDGTTTADTLTAAAASAATFIAQTATLTGNVILSIYVKAGTNSFVQILNSGDGQAFVNFNVSTGVVGTGGTKATGTITSVGNGWYRCSVKFADTTTYTNVWRVYLQSSASAGYGIAFAGTGTETVYIWGAQLEAVTYQTAPGAYIPTTTAAVYQPRFDYDPATLQPRGLLIEESRQNICLQSQTFNTTWTVGVNILAFGSGSVVDATTAPDGTNTADLLTESTAASGSRQITQIVTTTAVATTFSVYGKRNGRDFLALGIADSGNTSRTAFFNLSTGVVGTVGTDLTASITNVGNGWYRCVATISAANAGSNTVRIYMSNADNITSYAGDGTSGIYVWGAQVEVGAFATSYIPTAASAVTRAADVVKMSASGLAQIDAAKGTFFIQSDIPNVVSGRHILCAYNGSLSARAGNIFAATTTLAAFYTNYTGGLPQYTITNSLVAGQMRFAYAYVTNNLGMAYNGTLGPSDTSITPDITPNVVNFHSSTPASGMQCGWLQSFAYYNQRLPDATMQAKSIVGAPL